MLDFDATDDPVHGHQQHRFFHGYYDAYCFLPLYVFAGDHLLCADLQPSKIDGAKHSRAILKWLVTRLRERWPNVRRVGLANTEHATATVQTIRLKLFKVGAWVQKSVRRWVVRISSGYPWAALFATVAARLSGPQFVGTS